MRIQVLIVVSGALVSSVAATAEPLFPNQADVVKSCKVMAALGEKIKRCKQLGIVPATAPPRPPTEALAELLPPGTVQPAAVAPPVAPSQRPFWLLRQDQYDQLSYVIPTRGYQVLQGASVSYTDDQISKSQAVSTKGFAGYSVYNWRNPPDGCGSSGGPTTLNGLGVGPFVQADGSFNQPTNANEKSALRVGMNTDLHFCDTPAFMQEDYNFMAYEQTDFRGRANIAGFDALWEPLYVTNTVHLGGRADIDNPLPIDGYFRIMGEANAFHVGDNGLTNFLPHTNYALLGGTAEARAVLFENDPSVPTALCGTISLVGTARYLWDAVSRKPISLYGAEIDYRLGGGNPYAAYCKGGPQTAPDPANYAGSTSFALSYNQGTDALTFVKQNKYTASLKFSY